MEKADAEAEVPWETEVPADADVPADREVFADAVLDVPGHGTIV